jgi:DNA polymerase III sliding clamp (beta) subunit (PCNA family)
MRQWSNELVNVVAHRVTYDVKGDRINMSISGYKIRETAEEAEPADSRIFIEFGPTISKAAATKALQLVLRKIETDGLPCLMTTVEKRTAARLIKLQKDAAKESKVVMISPMT